MLTSSSRKFGFITTSGEPSKAVGDANRRRLVRTNAKRYSLQAHVVSADAQLRRAGNISAYTGRFHAKIVPKREKEDFARGSISRGDEHGATKLPESDNDVNNKAIAIRELQRDRSVSHSLDASKLDPFNTLSIKTGAQEELLFQYGNAAFELPSYIFNTGASLFRLVSTDPAWFHATLSLIALHHDLSAGQKISRLSLFHRGEALRLVQWRLQGGGESLIHDATIGAVASLVNFDSIIGDFASSTIHARGLTVMLSERGGIQSLEDEVLQKVVGWSDLTYSATWKQKPRYDVISTSYCDGTIQHILAQKYRFPAGTFHRTHGLDDDLNDIIEVLQALTVLADGSWRMEDHERNLMRCIYIVEYALLGLLEKSSASRGAVLLGFGLYLYLGLREVPRTATILGRTVKRLRSSFEQGEHIADDLGPLVLFWLSSLTVVAANGTDDAVFFGRIVDIMGAELNLQGADDRKEVLTHIIWTRRISDWN